MRKSVTLLLLCIGLIIAQERSISGGGSRRNQFSAGKSQAIGFNCPEDFGYYPHPSDCSQYYVCVFGGALLESCTGGLMYSNELQTCDWPRNVVCNDANGPGISTVKVTDLRTSARSSNQVLSATESLSTSSLKRADNAIRSREPVKSSGTSKSVFDDSSRLRQGRFILGQESTNQDFNTGFQAQETSSRAFNVVAASPSPKFVFPPLLPGVSSTNRFAAPTAAPAVAPARATPSVGQSFYNDLLNLNDTDYYYYYDDILYDDYYEPTTKTTPKPIRQSSRSRGNSPDLSNSVSVTSAVNNKGRGSSSRPSSASSPISSDSSFNSSPSSSFLGTFSSPPARTAVRTGGETISSVKQPKKSSSTKSSSSTRPSINQHSLSTPKPDSTSIDSSTNQRSSTALNSTVPSFSELSAHLPSFTNISQLNSHISNSTTTLPPKLEHATNTTNETILQKHQEKFSAPAKENTLLEPINVENSDFKPTSKLKVKNLKDTIDGTPSLSQSQLFASSAFDTNGSGPFAPPLPSPRIRIVENKNGFKSKPNSKSKSLAPGSESSIVKNQRLPFNLATVTFDLLRDRSRSLKDSVNHKSFTPDVNKAPTLLPLPLRPILTILPRLDDNEKFPFRSVTRQTTFLLPKAPIESTNSSHSPRLKGSLIPSHVRMVTSQPVPPPALISQRNTSALGIGNQNSSKFPRRISAPIPKRINQQTVVESGIQNSPTIIRPSSVTNQQSKRISTSQTLFKQMLNSERDNIIGRTGDTRILSSTSKPTRTTQNFSTTSTMERTIFTPSSTKITTITSLQATTKRTQELNSDLTTRNKMRPATEPTPKSVTTSTPKLKQTLVSSKMSAPIARAANFTPKPTLIKNNQIKGNVKSNTSTFASSTLKNSTTRLTKTPDNLSPAIVTPNEARMVKSSTLLSVVNETQDSLPRQSPSLQSQIIPRIPAKLIAFNASSAKPNSTNSSVIESKEKTVSSNFATITIAQLRSRNSDQKSILHPIYNLTHASLVTLKTAPNPSLTPIRPSIAPSLLNPSPLNRPTSKLEKFTERVDKNESSSINSNHETGPDRYVCKTGEL